ncbi:hypothetical protein [Blastococcus sp. PRF04-17]|uniref:hypothetical protein n=1 Tax=Blastococcus sp. PRF04-17 TaxID=2933797 RepID=UPI001FF647A9|nr:hypothetical protein [Blastococcus sp. PRF04-17]UOY03287.1 hypothetical protein MVA48_08075 [Blastococcus sp. PRF04-17]
MRRRPVGQILDAGTRAWVRLTGRRVDLDRNGWLGGPTGDLARVDDAWLADEVARRSGRFRDDDGDTGLLPSMALLDGPGFDAAKLRPEVRDFYEHTARWRLQVWTQWSPVAWPLGWLVSVVFARRLQQLSLPLRPLQAAHGMSSEVRSVVDADGTVLGTSWHRRLRSTGETVFSGWYGVDALPGADRPSIRVVFPLPNGRLVVLLRPEVAADGALLLTSTQGRWGDEGAYLVVQPPGRSRGWARRTPVHERFRVFVDDEGVLRTDHRIDLWRLPVLRLHYRLDRTDA